MAETSESANHQPAPIKRWPFTNMWTTHDVGNFIRDIGFSKYAKCFTNHMVNGRNMNDLSVFDLQRIGVDNMIDAIRIRAYMQNVSKKFHYNFDNPNEPPNVSYVTTALNAGPAFSWLPPLAEPACMELTMEDYRLPYRDQGSHNNRYYLPGPSLHYWRSICTRRNDDFP